MENSMVLVGRVALVLILAASVLVGSATRVDANGVVSVVNVGTAVGLEIRSDGGVTLATASEGEVGTLVQCVDARCFQAREVDLAEAPLQNLFSSDDPNQRVSLLAMTLDGNDRPILLYGHEYSDSQADIYVVGCDTPDCLDEYRSTLIGSFVTHDGVVN
ncbi:MAG: hypothetical protein GXP35_13050, partial [Actinobacteria bacterium]|nr:hypothetical protein [Actinomycetota bacterium]